MWRIMWIHNQRTTVGDQDVFFVELPVPPQEDNAGEKVPVIKYNVSDVLKKGLWPFILVNRAIPFFIEEIFILMV